MTGVMRGSVVLGVALVVATSAFAASTPRLHGLRQAEAAFYRAGLPFSTEWSPHPVNPVNPYLVPRRQNDDPLYGWVPTALRSHVIGWAGGVNNKTFATWRVFVFDRDPSAVAGANWQRRICKPASCDLVVLRADNVVYLGSRLTRAYRAMKRLGS